MFPLPWRTSTTVSSVEMHVTFNRAVLCIKEDYVVLIQELICLTFIGSPPDIQACSYLRLLLYDFEPSSVPLPDCNQK